VQQPTLEMTKRVFVQVSSQRAEDVPGTWLYMGPDPRMFCGTTEFHIVQCHEPDAAGIYERGQRYHAASTRLSPRSWALTSQKDTNNHNGLSH
jgi:hypothetical protein